MSNAALVIKVELLRNPGRLFARLDSLVLAAWMSVVGVMRARRLLGGRERVGSAIF